VPYHLHEVHLRVVHKYLRERRNSAIGNARFLVLEHLLPTTAEFVRLIREAGGDIHALIAKPYSIDPSTLAALEAEGFPIISESYATLEAGFLDGILSDVIAKSREDGLQIIVIDVGGYFADPLMRLSLDDVPLFAGARSSA